MQMGSTHRTNYAAQLLIQFGYVLFIVQFILVRHFSNMYQCHPRVTLMMLPAEESPLQNSLHDTSLSNCNFNKYADAAASDAVVLYCC
jgi:hypothetical protein